MGVKMQMTYANGQTMAKFAEVLAARQKWCGESARGSVAACAIDALKSLRAKTLVAKRSSVKVAVTRDNSLYASCSTNGSMRTPCVRHLGSGAKYAGKEPVRVADGARIKDMQVYRFADQTDREYLIIASSAKSAKEKAKQIATKRAMRYAGLAKRALGLLMYKTNTQRVADPLNPAVETKADEVTDKHESVTKTADGGIYTLVLRDSLRYALDALKGGRGEVDASLGRAMNKIVSVVNRKIKKHAHDFFAPQPLETPFPELKQRRAAL